VRVKVSSQEGTCIVFRASGRWPLAIVIGIVLLAVLIWPTLYRYDRMYDRPVRINRLTGTAQVLSASGWRTLGPARVIATNGSVQVWSERASESEPDIFDEVAQENFDGVVRGLESAPASR
jgi:hypothetical protein